jgi:hypothetical protein
LNFIFERDDPHFWTLLPWESKHSRKSNSKHYKKTHLENRIKAVELALDQQKEMLEKMKQLMINDIGAQEKEVNINGKRPRIKSEEH